LSSAGGIVTVKLACIFAEAKALAFPYPLTLERMSSTPHTLLRSKATVHQHVITEGPRRVQSPL
jgi:hypothetical protein